MNPEAEALFKKHCARYDEWFATLAEKHNLVQLLGPANTAALLGDVAGIICSELQMEEEKNR